MATASCPPAATINQDLAHYRAVTPGQREAHNRMMPCLTPATSEELAQALASAAASRQSIRLGGNFSKGRLGGPVEPADVAISTRALNRVLQYEPRDLTISVEAGMPFAELCRLLAENRQMVPLDPPWAGEATAGGVVAANTSGPRRRFYGTARDMIIGMTFATLEGKLIQSGGMVVKNVAGLDMAKLLIGSFGTLAAITVVNFRLYPMPPATRTFVLRADALDVAIAARDEILKSVLQPAAIDLLNPAAARRIGLDGHALLLQAGGSPAVLDRYSRELTAFQAVEDGESLWKAVQEFTPQFLAEHPAGAVARISSTLTGLRDVFASIDAPMVGRAGSGITYAHFADAAAVPALPGRSIVEGARAGDLSPDDFAMMVKVKELFDPHHLLNRGRLYGCL